MQGQTKPFSPDNNAEIQRLELALESAGVGTWEFDLLHNNFRWCRRTKALFGFTGDDIVTLEKVLERIHIDDRQVVTQAFKNANTTRDEGPFSIELRVMDTARDSISWLLCRGQSYFDQLTDNNRLLGSFINITKDVENRRQISENKQQQRTFQTIIEQAPMAIGLLHGREMIIDVGNEKLFEVWGKDKSITGMRLIDALPEIKDQMFPELLQNVYDTGEPFFGNGILAKLEYLGVLEDRYFDLVYTPMRDDDGLISGIIVLATEVTRQFNAYKDLEASESRFRSLIEQAPIATGFFTGKDMIVELANQPMIGYWGKDSSVIGNHSEKFYLKWKGNLFLTYLMRS